MKHASLTEKLIFYFLTLGISAIALVSSFAFFSTKNALLDRTYDQLTSLRLAKMNQLEHFFNDRTRLLSLLASADATKEVASNLENCSQAMNGKNEQISALFKQYLAKYLFFKNDFSEIQIIDVKKELILSGNIETGQVSCQKTALNTPFWTDLFEAVRTNGTTVTDLLKPQENDQEPYMYFGTTIKTEGNSAYPSCILLLKIPAKAINDLMLNNTPNNGLGKSGETYLVGPDFLMRSSSRFIDHSILNTRVRTGTSILANQGLKGAMITQDYRAIQVLSSYSQLHVAGLNWVILAEIDLKEAMIPIYKMRNTILFMSVFIAITFFILVFFIARKISNPIVRLEKAVDKVGKGDYSVQLPIVANDEIGKLTEAFNRMTEQIEEKTRELNYERTGRIRSVIDGEESERQRLSRELHDGIGQSIVALKLRLESLSYQEGPQVKEGIAVLKEQIDMTIDEIRRISNNLMPSVLEIFGVTLALKNLCTDTGLHSGMKVDFECLGNMDDIHTKIKTYVYRIAQEALNNIVKHSKATEVSLKLTRIEDEIILKIDDNGRGFKLEKEALERGNGLYNMKERVILMHGKFDIVSGENQGTHITVQLPIF